MTAGVLIATARAPWSGGPLALAPWDGSRTLVEYHIDQLQAAGVSDIEVVLGDDAGRVIPVVAQDNVEPIVNGAWASDPASSLRAGASAVVRGTTVAIVIEVAEPRPAELLRFLLSAHEGADATVPAIHGVRGTPGIVGEHALALLRNARSDATAIHALSKHAIHVREVQVDSDIVLLRADTQEDFDRIRMRLSER